jgi:hypothetical protein
MRTINQRAEHSSPHSENFRLARMTQLMDEEHRVPSLFFLFAHVLFTR